MVRPILKAKLSLRKRNFNFVASIKATPM